MAVAAQRFDAARLQQIDAFLEEHYVASGKLPHAQLLIGCDDGIVHFSHFGRARTDTNQAVDDRSLFRIASMTKPITSIAFIMLIEEGRVALDTPVHHVLPEFAELGVYVGGGGGVPYVTRPPVEPMRMVDLLRHTSGLTYGFQYRTNIDAGYRASNVDVDRIGLWHDGDDLDSFVAALAMQPLEFDPGTAWNYSVSTDVLGAVIQRVSGVPFDRFLAERIFQPLGMVDTGFFVPAEKSDRLTDCFAWRDETDERAIFDSARDSAWLRPPRLVSGGGGLISTSRDYDRFCRMCAHGGSLEGARLLSRNTLELMTMNHLPGSSDLSSLSRSMFSETQNAGAGFGLGFAVNKDVVRSMLPGSIGEYYWGGVFSTSFFIDPVERIHAIFMTQLTPSSTFPIRRQLKTMIYAALR